jgi:lipopolysaccharide/colanic/teichoic acid biosynthesis glycosyltransferase/dTDP-glucose pyrophosphorylase
MNGYLSKSAVKKAVILGEDRMALAPLTDDHPVWMFPVLNKLLIEYSIDFLKENGFEKVMIVLPSGKKEPEFLKGVTGIDIELFFEESPRGTAGILKELGGFLDNDTFLVMSGNLFIGHADLKSFIKFHVKKNSVATVGVHKNTSNSCAENITISADNSITDIQIPHSSVMNRESWRSSGIYLFSPPVISFIPQGKYMDIKEQLIPALKKESLNTYAYEIEDFHLCLNSVSDYINIHRDLLLKGGSNGYLADKEEIAERVWAGKNVTISPEAYLLGPVIIGDNCEIKAWAQIIGPTVIVNRCRVSEGVVIRESILWNDISLAKGSRIEYSVLSEKSDVPNNFSIKNTILVNKLHIEDVRLIPSDFNIKGIINLSDITSVTTRQKAFRTMKRAMDIVLSLSGIIFLLPVFLLVALAVKIDSPGPVFYRQKRCGIYGRVFNMIKFRTMVADAEKLQEELRSQKGTDGPMFKMIDDPRITRLGRFLRKTSIDELPQLFNVLRGEMSIVGPRPLIMDEMKFSPSWRDTRLKIKPGITGLWQVQGRSEAPFHDWIRYDIYYVQNESFLLDIQILLKTLKVVLKRAGAY